MSKENMPDVLVLGAGPAGMAIASALGKEKLEVEVLSPNGPDEPWPNTYGIWGKEVDQLGLQDLLEYRWKNTVSFFGHGALEEQDDENKATVHSLDYGLFDKKKLHNFWFNECNKSFIKWHQGFANKIHFEKSKSTVTTKDGKTYSARLVVDATGYDPVFLKLKSCGPLAVQTCYGIVGNFSKPPLKKGQFVLMDYRNDHLNDEQKKEPPTFLYAMDMGDGKYFLEETSLGLVNPLTMENLKQRLEKRLTYRNISITSMQHEELGLFLPMNMPIPDFRQQIIFDKKNLIIINDSKSTSFASSENVLKNLNDVYWILGGIPKKGDKFKLSKIKCKNIKAYIFGSHHKEFIKILKNRLKIKKFKNLKETLKVIFSEINIQQSKKNIIFFSPAGASFDSFKNFEDRGYYFNQIIKKYINAKR